MCGIAGIAIKNDSLDIRHEIKGMTDALVHRGPDGEGYLLVDRDPVACSADATPKKIIHSSLPFAPKVQLSENHFINKLAFGHRRLSIIELSEAGHQPMCDQSKNFWITYNGELYNYIELRAELVSLGCNFLTESDTEVILNAYMKWGESCVDRFNGMWAFVIYNHSARCLFGSRDRLGVKPLYYFKDDSTFVFASEQKAFFKTSFISPKANFAAQFDFFVFNEIEFEEEGMFKDIFELFAGHSFRFDLQAFSLKKWRYYQFPIVENHIDDSNEVLFAKKVADALQESVRLRMRSDVPIGSCLSGGIDSSSIVMLMDKIQNDAPLNLFTASFDKEDVDESKWAKIVADQTNGKWHQVFANSQDLFGNLNDLIYSQDIPLWSTSTFAQYSVMKRAKKEGIKVVLDGQGGDELFAGYPQQHIFYIKQLVDASKFNLAVSEINMNHYLPSPWKSFAKQYFRHFGKRWIPAKQLINLYKKYNNELAFLDNDFLEEHSHRYEKYFDAAATSLNEQLRKELDNNLLKSYLKCEDRCSMWHSVESRTPFADDPKLIELSLSIPANLKIKNGQNKYILRESMKPYLPREIYNRKDKMGFATPNERWIAEIKDSVLSSYFDKSAVINSKKIRNRADELFDFKHQRSSSKMFKFISFSVWESIFKL